MNGVKRIIIVDVISNNNRWMKCVIVTCGSVVTLYRSRTHAASVNDSRFFFILKCIISTRIALTRRLVVSLFREISIANMRKTRGDAMLRST